MCHRRFRLGFRGNVITGWAAEPWHRLWSPIPGGISQPCGCGTGTWSGVALAVLGTAGLDGLGCSDIQNSRALCCCGALVQQRRVHSECRSCISAPVSCKQSWRGSLCACSSHLTVCCLHIPHRDFLCCVMDLGPSLSSHCCPHHGPGCSSQCRCSEREQNNTDPVTFF